MLDPSTRALIMNLATVERLTASASSVADDVSHSPVVWALLGGALVIAAIANSMRAVPEHQRLVVTRLGRVVRVVGPGLVWRVIGLERWSVVSLRPVHQMLDVAALTEDGVSVHVRVSVQCHVTEPARSIVAAADPLTETFSELESHLAREVAATQFMGLLSARRRYESDLPALVTGATSAWGVEVISIELGDIEVMLTPDLMHTLRDGPTFG